MLILNLQLANVHQFFQPKVPTSVDLLDKVMHRCLLDSFLPLVIANGNDCLLCDGYFGLDSELARIHKVQGVTVRVTHVIDDLIAQESLFKEQFTHVLDQVVGHRCHERHLKDELLPVGGGCHFLEIQHLCKVLLRKGQCEASFDALHEERHLESVLREDLFTDGVSSFQAPHKSWLDIVA